MRDKSSIQCFFIKSTITIQTHTISKLYRTYIHISHKYVLWQKCDITGQVNLNLINASLFLYLSLSESQKSLFFWVKAGKSSLDCIEKLNLFKIILHFYLIFSQAFSIYSQQTYILDRIAQYFLYTQIFEIYEPYKRDSFAFMYVFLQKIYIKYLLQ